MCGGFGTQNLSWREIVELSRLATSTSELPAFADADRFPMRLKQKAPTDWNRSPIIIERNGIREAVEAVWGLVPATWKKELKDKRFDTFNAKVERLREASSYRDLLDDHRCLVPVSWFYEFTGPKGAKTRHKCSLGDGPTLLLGLWDYNERLDLLSFTIITTAPGEHFGRYHHRVAGAASDEKSIDAHLSGNVEVMIEQARQSNGDRLIVDPPEPASGS